MTKHYRDANLEKALASNAPKWLKQVFKTVCQELDHFEGQIEQVFGREETNVSILRLGEPQSLPKNSRIEFIVNGLPIDVSIREEHDGETLDINGGSASLFINPRAINSCYIRIQRQGGR